MSKEDKQRNLLEKLIKENQKLSKAEKMKMLITLQGGLMSKKKKLVDFQEPIMFLIRRDGNMEFYDKVTSGKFVFKHSTGEERWIEIRPQDQLKFDYGDRRVRCYVGHEDRPFTGFDDAILDTESIVTAMNKINATNMKYEEALLREKNKGIGKKVGLWLGIALAIAIVGFAIATWVIPAITKARASGTTSGIEKVVGGLILIGRFKLSNALKKRCNNGKKRKKR